MLFLYGGQACRSQRASKNKHRTDVSALSLHKSKAFVAEIAAAAAAARSYDVSFW
jgi:hypothetical protein